MARKKRNPFRLGLTVITMIGLAVAFALFISGGRLTPSAKKPLLVRFPESPGMPYIGEGSYVHYLGQPVGRVTGTKIIKADPEDDTNLSHAQQFLEVTAEIKEDIDLYDNCEIMASAPPLSTKGVIDIVRAGDSTTMLDPSQRAEGKIAGFRSAVEHVSKELDETNDDGLLAKLKNQLDASDPESLIYKLSSSMADLNDVTSRLKSEMNAEDAATLLAKIHDSLDHLKSGLANLSQMIDDKRPQLESAADSVAQAARTIDETLAREFDLPDKEPSEDPMIVKIHASLTALNHSLDNVEATTADARQTVAMNRDELDRIISNASDASAHLKSGIAELRTNPWRLFYKPTAEQQKEVYLFNTARRFAEASAHLDRATTQLSTFIEAFPEGATPDNDEFKRLRADLATHMARFAEAEQALLSELRVD